MNLLHLVLGLANVFCAGLLFGQWSMDHSIRNWWVIAFNVLCAIWQLIYVVASFVT